ncbi:FAD/NAD(P)-binding protein [Streptomyces sp. M19]
MWRTAQPPELLMNTVASQVTLFTDPTVVCEGPVRTGPSLYEWVAAHGADPGWVRTTIRAARCTAAIWSGSSARWCGRPGRVEVRVHRARAVRLAERGTGSRR